MTRYAWGPCPFPGGCDEPRPHAHVAHPAELGRVRIDVELLDPDGRRWYHPGHPVDPGKAAELEAAGLPVYRPADPVAIDQLPHLDYLARTEDPPR